MPVIKIPSIKSVVATTGVTSSNVSSSVSGNMNLIQSQIQEKTNEYINIKNAVNILEKYSNWNGYIKLYTEVESNFEVGDTVYITYVKSTINTGTTFNLDNNYSNSTNTYYDDPFNANVNQYSFGYKILYVNYHKNELVINRYYKDITPGTFLSNQCLSKVTCRDGNFFQKVADGVVFFNCNVFNSDYSILEGIVSGITFTGVSYTSVLLSGATISCAGTTTTSDENGYYSMNLTTGTKTVDCSATLYLPQSISTTIIANQVNILNITLVNYTTTTSTTLAPTTTTSTTFFATTTLLPTTSPMPPSFFELFGQLYNL